MSSNQDDLCYKIRLRLINFAAKALGVPVIPLRSAGPVEHKWHQNFIINLASVLRPEKYLELGIFHCGLFNQMIPFAGDLTGVDIAPEAGSYMAASPKAKFVCSSTDDYAAKLRQTGAQFDMIFIDADHSKQAVTSDFSNYLPLLRPHGILMLHDTHPIDQAATDQARCGDGYQAIEGFSRQSDEWEMMTIPVHPGLTICRKRKKQLSWQE